MRLLILALTLTLWSLPAQADDKREHIRKLALPKNQNVKGQPPKKAPDASASRTTDRGKKIPGVTAVIDASKGHAGNEPGLPKRCEEKHPIETFVQISAASRPQASRKGG